MLDWTAVLRTVLRFDRILGYLTRFQKSIRREYFRSIWIFSPQTLRLCIFGAFRPYPVRVYEFVSFYVSSYRHCYTANPSNQSNFGLVGCAGIQVDLNLDKWTCIIFTWVNVFKVFRVFLLLSNLNVFSGLNVFYSPKFFCLQSSTVVTNQSWVSNSKILQGILLIRLGLIVPFTLTMIGCHF